MTDLTPEQLEVLNCDKKNMIISASAGSGKTFILIKYITELLLKKHVPLRRMLILTFTRAAAGEMRERLNKALLGQNQNDDFVLEQLDDLSIADISTIDSFCEKLIRRNIDKLQLDESFRLLENPEMLKFKAFETALVNFAKADNEKMSEIFFCFRRNKDVIFKIMLKLEEYFTFEPQGKAEYLLENQQALYEQAKNLLNKKLVADFNSLQGELALWSNRFIAEPKYDQFCKVLQSLFNFELGSEFEDNVKRIKLIDIPRTPIVKGENRDEKLSAAMTSLRAKCQNLVSYCKKFNFEDEILINNQKSGSLAVALILLFKCYQSSYAQLKAKLDVLDFVDIESCATKLIEDGDVLAQLQEKYDYIFIDEYQDTNRVQEAIIKPLAKKGHFVAVGDPKQGVYGFRNATMEIMQKDIADFSADSEADALYLTGNFRSDKRILNFINKIFVKVMTEETVGIDYKKNSKLKGQISFKKMDLPAVRVDIVSAEEEKEKFEPNSVYSVKNDTLQTKDRDALEVDTIIARIDELLMHDIYDEKAKKYRKIEFDDIAILMRSRSSLMGALADKLNRKGYPCYADAKDGLASDGTIQMLINLLKLLLNKNDDIALISVMNSKLGGFTLDELASMRIEFPDEKHFYDVYSHKLCDDKVANFDNELNNLKLQAQVKGLSAALRQFFIEKDFFAYLKLEDLSKYTKVLGFLRDIKAKDFDFDIAGAVAYFCQTGGSDKNNLPSGSGIKIMTIHASKGLEFPVVILAGCGNRLEKPPMRIYELCSEFGLCLPAFNQENNTRCTTPNLEGAKLLKKRKEMIDEIMIFYVALTRAKNHLYIVGQEKAENLLSGDFDVMQAKNYLSIIAHCFGDNFIEKLTSSQQQKVGSWEFNIVDNVKKLEVEAQEIGARALPQETKDAVAKFLDFEYPSQNCLINVKNSVTSLNKHDEFVSTQTEKFSVEQGNAYHQALKILDFEKIFDIASLNEQLDAKKGLFDANYFELIDKNILLKNILLIKSVVGKSKLFKEKQFVMSARICDISSVSCQDEVLVQGIVDLFAIGEENILIDYKFTGQTNPQIILERYSKQLDLYSDAIEKAFGIKISKKYLLSLKNSQLIEYLK